MFNPLPYALARRQVRLAIPTTDVAASLYEAVILPLWHEAEHAPGVPHDRPDVWRVLFRDVLPNGHASWRPGHIRASDCDALAEDGITTPADIVTNNRPGTLARAEMLCVFARFAVPIRFAYDKGQGVFESRHGVPLGFKSGKEGTLLVLADADRDGATRSFKLGAVSGIVAVGPIPSWEPMVGWMMPAATTVDPDADAAGVTAAEVDEMTGRRGRA